MIEAHGKNHLCTSLLNLSLSLLAFTERFRCNICLTCGIWPLCCYGILMLTALSQCVAAACSRIQAGSQRFSWACVSGHVPSQGSTISFFCLLLCRVWCCAPSLSSSWREWKELEILALPGHQEVLAEMRARVPSSWDNVKEKRHSLVNVCPPCVGQSVIREICWCAVISCTSQC